MLKPLVRWGMFSIAALAAGPVAWLATSHVHGTDGGPATGLVSTTPALGILLSIGAVLIATIVGIASAKFVQLHAGLFNAGIVLAWAAFGTGTIDAVARSSPTASLGWKIAIEGAILAVVGGLSAWTICRAAGLPHPDDHADGKSDLQGIAMTVGICLVCGLGGAWLVAQNLLKLQVIAAAAVAAVLGGAVSGMMNPRVQPWAILIGVFAAGFVGPLVGTLMHGSTPGKGFVDAATTVTHLARFAGVLPLDWLAGGLLGVPMGLSLGGWIGDGRRHAPASAAA